MSRPRAVVVAAALVAVGAVGAVGAACASAPQRALADSSLGAARAAASSLDVDLTLLPAELAGAVGGVSLRYCARAASSWPRRLAPENRQALAYLVAATDDNTGHALVVDSDGVRTDSLGSGDCARLVVDIARMADTIADRDLALRAGDDLVVTPDLWLWRGAPSSPEDRLHLESVPSTAGLQALLPWDVGSDGRAVVDGSTFAQKSDAAFGAFAVEDVEAAGAHFLIARLDHGDKPARFSAWLRASASAVSSVLGRYPFQRVNVLVVPTPELRPIVVGFFSRGGGPTATFFVGADSDNDDDSDLDATGRWAITHELSHPLLPPVNLADAWLNEGLATWHQDLLARTAGLLRSDRDYWQELLRGLDTGAARAAEDKMALADASARMHEDGTYQHAYWAGVAVVFLAEVEARKQGASVDDFVRAVRARFPVDDRPRGALELLAAIDDGSSHKGAIAARALASVFGRYRTAPFPPVDDALRALGVRRTPGGDVIFDDAAPLADIRRAITRAR